MQSVINLALGDSRNRKNAQTSEVKCRTSEVKSAHRNRVVVCEETDSAPIVWRLMLQPAGLRRWAFSPKATRFDPKCESR